MADLNMALDEAVRLNRDIRRFLKLTRYDEYDDLSGLDFDRSDGQQIFLRDELRLIADRLADVRDFIDNLTRPIVEESRLRKDAAGRYCTGKGHYYCCSSRIEAFVSDEYHDAPYWIRTTVEHNGEDYYLVGCRGVSMRGLRVRVRA